MVDAVAALPRAMEEQFEKSGVAMALSDTSPDAPLVLVNEAFCTLTGYSRDEVEGVNCRFLQGEGTTAEQRQALHDFVHDESVDAGRFPVLNYRKNGEAFLNFVFMTRLRDSNGVTRFIIASQFDLTDADRRSRVRDSDAELGRRLSDVEVISREFGLAMIGSAKILADSAATIARLSIDESIR